MAITHRALDTTKPHLVRLEGKQPVVQFGIATLQVSCRATRGRDKVHPFIHFTIYPQADFLGGEVFELPEAYGVG